jgi:hypothetical protein
MTPTSTQDPHFDLAQAQDEGRRQGLAIAALAAALVAFLNLLGAEKSILAIVLATVAMSGSSSRLVRRRSLIAIGLAAMYIATMVAVLVIFRNELAELVRLLSTLG